MIDIETKNKRDLKNIRQIGAPTESDRIYIENAAYARIHEEDYAERRIFIFMGHTECTDGKYTTFVEAAIPVHNVEFVQNVPQWNTHAWSDVFREIKRSYENSIIVGWAMDIKGFVPRLTAELEAVHREQFGGAHQVLFLLDSLEGEEYFFLNKGSHLQKKEGFYIYYSREMHKVRSADVVVEPPKRESRQVIPQVDEEVRGRYRESMQKKEENKGGRKASSYAMVAAVALLLSIVGVGAVQGRIHIPELENTISAMSDKIRGKKDPAEVLVGTEIKETQESTQKENATLTETLDLIPIEEIPAGKIEKTGESKDSEAADTQQDKEKDTEQNTEEEQEKKNEADETAASANADKKPEYYTVKAGDTLTGISLALYGSTNKIPEIVSLNQMENSDDIHVGQKLRLP